MGHSGHGSRIAVATVWQRNIFRVQRRLYVLNPINGPS
jgi:hypothetical protein